MAMQPTHARTLGEMRRLVFPNGTREVENGSLVWEKPPVFASDIFAFCAYVIQITGLMGYFEPDENSTGVFAADEPLRVALSADDRKQRDEAAQAWRDADFGYPLPPPIVDELWAIIEQAQGEQIHVRRVQKKHKDSSVPSAAPAWWRAIFMLLVIADEACDGIGHYYSGADDRPSGGSNSVPDLRYFDALLKENRAKENAEGGMYAAAQQVSTICYSADKHIVCVQPKGRVTQVGCSTRNLSRNLSLTGPAGGVRCSWQQLATDVSDEHLRNALNILLIPLPLSIRASAFCNIHTSQASKKWGSFAIDQHWLPEKTGDGYQHDANGQNDFIDYVKGLVIESQTDSGPVDAIVFPELSLTYPIFKKLFETLIENNGVAPNLHFMIAGSSNNCEKEQGNFVLTAIRERRVGSGEASEPALLGDDISVYSQRKHHRWRMTEDQISTYGLASVLSPDKAWWEEHQIDSRELNFFQFRRDTVFASLICEDLARNDPCLDIMRSVAPNLIFALLMDGPQIASRWSARYAGSLADDPGSTVITLTSFGLIKRSNFQFSEKGNRSIGFIRDGEGSGREITLPDKHEAVLLTLGSKTATDYTIDGRPTTNASAWRYISQRPIMLKRA
jgi:hypothetical protein